MKNRFGLFALTLLAFGLLTPFVNGVLAKEVVIGVMYPLSGPIAQTGIDEVAALRTVIQIVEEKVDINLPLARTRGLTNLGRAKIRLIVVDHQGKPDVGQAEAERLITREKVHALFGAYHSSVTAASSQVAERFQIPFVNGESASPKLTKRGFKWFFRTSPHDGEFTQVMFDFMEELQKRKGIKIKSVGIMHEDTLWGTDSGRVQEGMSNKAGLRITNKIAYRSRTTSLNSEVQRLKAADPDVFLPSSYTSDAMLFLRTAKDLNYNPKLVIAQNAGYTDPTFVSTMGKDAEGVITRSPFNLDLASRIPKIKKVNELFKKHSKGRDLSEVPARAFTGFLTLLDAINRAGSTEPEKIRQALIKTNIPPDQLIVPWKGIRFGPDGHNSLVRGILMQVQKGRYCTIFPFELAACEVLYPMPSWKEKAGM
jgi:branched-chain amino acid transport system substrate-binding protein